jgi:hypothetical protein
MMASIPIRLAAALVIATITSSMPCAATPALAGSVSGPSALQQAVDVQVDEYAFRDPPYWLGRFHYGFAVVNNGPETAVNVRFTDIVPEEATFDSIEIRSSFGEPLDIPYEAPAPGERGTITFVVDEIAPEDWVSAIVYLRPVAEPGTVFVNTATVGIEGGDLDPQNDSYSIPYRVPDPPLVYSVKALEHPDEAKP